MAVKKKAPMAPEFGQKWINKKGEKFEVIAVANNPPTPKYPLCVVCQGKWHPVLDLCGAPQEPLLHLETPSLRDPHS